MQKDIAPKRCMQLSGLPRQCVSFFMPCIHDENCIEMHYLGLRQRLIHLQ